MSCRDVEAEGHRYRTCPDDPPRPADRLRAVVRWTAVDEISQDPPDVDFTIESAHPGLRGRAGSGGVMGLVGNPGRLFPGLGAVPVNLEFSLAAPGYIRRHLTASLGPVPGFPDAFTPVDLGQVALHRTAVVLRGRVVRRAPLAPMVVAGATISLLGVWSRFPAANVMPDSVIEPANMVSLFPGLYADRASVVDKLVQRVLTPVVGQDKRLVLPAVRGDRTVRLSNRVLLNVGDILAIDPAHADRVEYLRVASIKGLSTDDQPAYVGFEHPWRSRTRTAWCAPAPRLPRRASTTTSFAPESPATRWPSPRPGGGVERRHR